MVIVWAVPQLGSCASSGRAWRLRAARYSQEEAGPLGAQPLPRVLERSASKAAHLTAFEHPGIFWRTEQGGGADAEQEAIVSRAIVSSTAIVSSVLPPPAWGDNQGTYAEQEEAAHSFDMLPVYHPTLPGYHPMQEEAVHLFEMETDGDASDGAPSLSLAAPSSLQPT